MILFFNNSPGGFTPDSIQTGIERVVAGTMKALKAQNLSTKDWDGDKINVKKQLPIWIQTIYDENPANAPVVDFFIEYYRWLFDHEGYGFGFYLEDLRDPFYLPSFLYQAYADLIFYGQLDFEEYPELLDNFKSFLINYHEKYVPIKGTPDGLVYVLRSIFGATTASVFTTSNANIKIITNLNSNYRDLFVRLACPYSFNVTFA